MNNEQMPTMAEMSGETKTSPRLILNELQYHGQQNKFFLVDKKAGFVQVGDKKKYNKVEVGDDAKVIFLRIRRKLVGFRKGEKPLTTNEHNTKYDTLTLFGDTNIVKGTNDELKDRYSAKLLKTVQIVYCLLLREGFDPELVRIQIKGSSLGSESKAKETETFYSYLASFKKGGADDHFYEYITRLFGVPEESPLGSYFSMTFAQDEKIADNVELMAVVQQNMKQVFDFVTASDAYYKTKTVKNLNDEKEKERNNDLPEIEYPDEDDEDINPSDIPF